MIHNNIEKAQETDLIALADEHESDAHAGTISLTSVVETILISIVTAA